MTAKILTFTKGRLGQYQFPDSKEAIAEGLSPHDLRDYSNPFTEEEIQAIIAENKARDANYYVGVDDGTPATVEDIINDQVKMFLEFCALTVFVAGIIALMIVIKS